jgi:hypothetical protein
MGEAYSEHGVCEHVNYVLKFGVWKAIRCGINGRVEPRRSQFIGKQYGQQKTAYHPAKVFTGNDNGAKTFKAVGNVLFKKQGGNSRVTKFGQSYPRLTSTMVSMKVEFPSNAAGEVDEDTQLLSQLSDYVEEDPEANEFIETDDDNPADTLL